MRGRCGRRTWDTVFQTAFGRNGGTAFRSFKEYRRTRAADAHRADKGGRADRQTKKPAPENTSAAVASGQEAAPLLQEVQKLLERAQRLLKIGKTRTVFSLISEEKPEWLAILQEQKEAFDKVVTDEPAVYNALSGQEASGAEVSFYTDEKISLFQLYGLSAKLDEAL